MSRDRGADRVSLPAPADLQSPLFRDDNATLH
jgi:hypothetical protein